jgi:hypothetical protein
MNNKRLITENTRQDILKNLQISTKTIKNIILSENINIFSDVEFSIEDKDIVLQDWNVFQLDMVLFELSFKIEVEPDFKEVSQVLNDISNRIDKNMNMFSLNLVGNLKSSKTGEIKYSGSLVSNINFNGTQEYMEVVLHSMFLTQH